MSRDLLPAFSRYFRQLTTTVAPDERLLTDYLARRDEKAFATLVQRHGPMVWSLCRRILRDTAAAEDVFQATFLLLSERAASIRHPAALASWLHGVAYRLAVRAKRRTAKLRAEDVSSVPDSAAGPADELAARELFAALDEELLRLPEQFRLPLVLCYLQGRTRDEAARELGWSVGTLRRRLEQGRNRLHVRLTRRGLTLSAVLAGVLVNEAAVPPALRAAVVAAMRGLVPSGVASLARAGGMTMAAASVKRLTALGVCLALLGVGFVTLAPAGSDPEGLVAEGKPVPAALGEADARRVDEVLRLAAEAIAAAGPNDVSMIRELAVLQAKRGNAPAARASLERLAARLAANPQRSFAMILLGYGLGDAGDRTSALALLDEALLAANTIPDANQRDDIKRLAVVSMAEKVDQAKALERVAAIPSENDRLNALKDIATEQAKAGDVAGALQSVDKMRAAPGYYKFDPWQAIAAAQLKAGDRASARATLQLELEAVEDARLKKIYDNLGCLFKQVVALCRFAVGQSKANDHDGALATLARVDRMIGAGKQSEHAKCLAALARAQAEAGERRTAEQTCRRLRKLALESFDITDYSTEDILQAEIALEDWAAAARTAARLGSSNFLQQVCEAQARAGQADAALARAQAEKSAENKAWELLGVARGLLNRVPPERLPRYDGTLAVKIPASPIRASPPLSTTPPDPIFEYQDLVAEYSRAWQAFNERLAKVNSEEARRRLLEKERPRENDYAKRFLQLARKHAGEHAAFQSLCWIGEFASNTRTAETALVMLRQDYLTDRQIGNACAQAGFSRHLVAAELLMREVLAKTPHRMARGQACLALADLLKIKAVRARGAQRPLTPAESRWHEEWYAEAALQDLKAADPAKLVAEAETLYERVLKEFGELQPDRASQSLGASARSTLNEIRFLAIGKTAPDISGEDLDGQPLKLSDYRGKVVVLTFWATWCGPCRAQIPSERELVKRLAGRPFVLLGVNGDSDRAKLREWLAKEPLPWRSWWDHQANEEKGQGPIARAWNVSSWPTVYVLDARGVIRYRDVVGQDLDRAVDILLKELDGQ